MNAKLTACGLMACFSSGVFLPGSSPDSALQVVRSADHSRSDTLLTWVVGRSPLLELGRPGDSVFFTSIVLALQLSDGGVVVADAGLNEVYWFGPDGSKLRTRGGTGDGPGEFRRIGGSIAGRDGRVEIFDATLQRLTRFSVDGEVESVSTVGDGQRLFGGVGLFESGTYFARTRDRLVAVGIDGLARDTVGYFALSPDGRADRQIGRVPGLVTTSVLISGRRGTRAAVYSPTALAATAGDCLYLMASDIGQVRVFHQTGRLVDLIQWDARPQRVRADHRRAWIDWMESTSGVSRGSPESQFLKELGGRLRSVESLPLAQDFVVDELGYLWMQVYEAPQGIGSTWVVLKGSGEPIETIRLPEPLRVLDISLNTITAVATGPTGEESLRIYSLLRGGDDEPSLQVPRECRGDALALVGARASSPATSPAHSFIGVHHPRR